MECNITSSLLPSVCPTNCPPLTGATATSFMLLLNALLSTQCKFLSPSDYAPDMAASLQNESTYDFIIVGAGSAGSVVAARLTEANPKWRVLLLEAGQHPTSDNEIPAMFNQLQGGPQDWAYRTVPQRNACYGLIDHASRWPRGKVLGGSSQLNAMIYARGHPTNYNHWAALGNAGWSYDDVLPYFRKAEHFIGVNDQQDGVDYGTEGPLLISRLPADSQWMRALRNASFILTGRDVGLDPNGHGFYTAPLTVGPHRRRSSTARCYLTRPIVRDRLKMALGVEVIRIMRNGPRVTGVQLRMPDGSLKVTYASKEVVLSAGSINTPKLLLQSGFNLPGIGRNLQDHITTFNLMLAADPSGEPSFSFDQNLFSYLMEGKGPLGTTGLSNAIWFLHSDRAIREDEHARALHPPNLQVFFMEFARGDSGKLQLFADIMGVNNATVRSMIDLVMRKQVLFVGIAVLYPQSIGHLKWDGQRNKLSIDANYLSDVQRHDIEALLGGVEYFEEILNTPGMRQINAGWARIQTGPECDRLVFASRDYFECYIRHFATTVYHPVGTCKMGPDASPIGGAVVDAKLRVWGTKHLRVIDSSVMPTITGGNTNAPTIMIAEKGADLLMRAHSHSKYRKT